MAKDIYHDLVEQALISEGWIITHNPYNLYFGGGLKKVMADLGAEKWIVAEKEDSSTDSLTKIVVEVKSFITNSNVNELHHAIGLLDFYSLLLQKQEPDRILYLAMPKYVYEDLIIEPVVQEFLSIHHVKLIIFDIEKPIIYQWIK